MESIGHIGAKTDSGSFQIVLRCCPIDNIVPKNDIKDLVHFGNSIKKNIKPTKFPRIIETMHNGKRDSIKIVSTKTILIVTDWAERILKKLFKEDR